jgi:hypothetical protein
MRGLRRPPSIAYRMVVDPFVTSSVGSGDRDKAIPQTIEILVVWRWIEGGRWKKTLQRTTAGIMGQTTGNVGVMINGLTGSPTPLLPSLAFSWTPPPN